MQGKLDAISGKDDGSWNEMIVGYAQKGLAHSGKEGILLEKTTSIILLQRCTVIGLLHRGREVHKSIIENWFGWDFLLGNVLVMYSKCGSKIDSQLTLASISELDIVYR